MGLKESGTLAVDFLQLKWNQRLDRQLKTNKNLVESINNNFSYIYKIHRNIHFNRFSSLSPIDGGTFRSCSVYT